MKGSHSAETKAKRPPKPVAVFEPIERFVYIGRQYLGRYVQSGKKKFEAFDARRRSLGVFRSAAKSLAAINQVGAAE
jgi:hypothetical protein